MLDQLLKLGLVGDIAGAGGGLPTGTCGAAADSDLAVAAASAADVRILAVNVYEYQSSDNTLQGQLIDLATRTGSYVDLDGDGIMDDPSVLYGSWNWPEITLVVDALEDLAGL